MAAGKGKSIFEVVLSLGFPFKVALDWRYPAPHKQRGKDQNTQLPLQKVTTFEKILLVRDRACDLSVR